MCRIRVDRLFSDELGIIKNSIKKNFIRLPNGYQNACSKYLNSNGKMIRPILVVLTAKACNSHFRGGQYKLDSIQLGIGSFCEMIHSASLIHDDIVDNSSIRRGMSTVHAEHGESMAVFAGDFIMGCAASTLAQFNNPQVISILNQAITDLITGEWKQLSLSAQQSALLSEESKMTQDDTQSSNMPSNSSMELSSVSQMSGLDIDNIRKSILKYNSTTTTQSEQKASNIIDTSRLKSIDGAQLLQYDSPHTDISNLIESESGLNHNDQSDRLLSVVETNDYFDDDFIRDVDKNVDAQLMDDTFLNDPKFKIASYIDKCYLKTASLIANSLKACCYVACDSHSEDRHSSIESVFNFGRDLGIAFQLIDDNLDFSSTSQASGKPVGADIHLGFYTAPLIYAYRQDSKIREYVKHFIMLKQHQQMYMNGVIENDYSAEYKQLASVIIDLVSRNSGIDFTRKLAQFYLNRAFSHIDFLENTQFKQALIDFSTQMIQRTK